MENIKGTQTETNLWTAFAGESMATNKYLYFAQASREQGYEQIAAIFEETAFNERAHAKIWYEALNQIGALPELLAIAIDGEHGEWADMYPAFEKQAKEDGQNALATLFHMVGEVEKTHEQRYQALLDMVNSETCFQKSQETQWVCRNCGHIHTGLAAPEQCPVCKKSKAYFEVKVPIG